MAVTAANGLNEAQAIQDNTGLVKAIAKTYAKKYHQSEEDLAQEGLIGLLTAIRKWSPEGGASLRTYANAWITVCVRDAIGRDRKGRIKPEPRHASLDAPLSAESPLTLLDCLVDMGVNPEQACANAEVADLVGAAIHVLTDREKEILRLRFSVGLTMEETGRSAKISKSQINRIERCAIEKIQAKVKTKAA